MTTAGWAIVPTTDPAPFCRTLQVGMGGADVAAYQLMLHNFTLDNPRSRVRTYGISPDPIHHFGYFGTPMAGQVEHFRKLHNEAHPQDTISPSGGMIGPRIHRALTRWAGPDAQALLREQWKLLHPESSADVARTIAVHAMRNWYAHRGVSIYSGPGHSTIGRRWDGIESRRMPPDFPRYSDCSAGCTWALWVAADDHRDHVHDPSQNGWAWGSTLSMAPHGKAVTASGAEPGDLFFYGTSVDHTTHVAMMVEKVNGVPYVIGFGSQGGPSFLPYRYRHDVVLVRSYIY